MQKIAFMFPGVGSQYVGMGKDFHDRFPIFRATIEEAGDVLARDPAKLCFESTPAELSLLENAQAAVLVVSVALFRVFLQETGIEPDFCLGHSLGEYSALCCAGVISFTDVLKIVRRRGSIIGETAASLDGTMMWVINLEQARVREICEQLAVGGEAVYVSAFDSPTQTSISGGSRAVMTAARQMEAAGAIVYPLKMNGPFHSPMMTDAARRMKSELERYRYNPPQFPVIANRHAGLYRDRSDVIDNLSQQLVSPIRWRDSLEYLWAQGVGAAVEMGPKDVLTFLLKKNQPAFVSFKMDKVADLEICREKLLVGEEDYLQVIGRCLGMAVGTRNRNPDPGVYEREVIQPYRRIAAVYEELKNSRRVPGREQVEEVLAMLRSLLTAKWVPEQQQREGLKKILGNRRLRIP